MRNIENKKVKLEPFNGQDFIFMERSVAVDRGEKLLKEEEWTSFTTMDVNHFIDTMATKYLTGDTV